MAKAIYVDEKTGILLLAFGLLFIWAALAPDQMASTFDTAAAAVDGAIEGAQGAL